jgi:adenylate kinase
LSVRKDIFVFLGPPGSGKGSLSQWCVKRLGLVQFSVGNLCRQHVADNTQIGKQIDFFIKSGKLITDSLIIQMVDEWLREQIKESKAIILDGFPRTVAQAAALHRLLQLPSFESIRLNIIKMNISDASIIERLSGRLICESKTCQTVYSFHTDSPLKPRYDMTCDECLSLLVRRVDDKATAIAQRLVTYHQHERELLDFYVTVDQKVYNFDVELPLEQVYDQFLTIMDSSLHDYDKR